MKRILLFLFCNVLAQFAVAQLSTNKDKFLGNITTGWDNDMDYDGFIFSDYWNQVTPENATKWEQVEGTRGTYNWWGADKAANYAQQHGFPFKFHTLVWGSQYPKWMDNLSEKEQFKAIEKWMDEVKKHFPDLQIIDVVNEAIASHAPAPFKDALGGDGTTGYDWIIKAFEMAAERWPNAILIYNDYNTFQHNTDEFITLVRTLRDAGAPVDAYGCQSHELGGMNGSTLKSAMTKIQQALQMPMYITEYDIADTNDGNQNWNYQQHIPLMWEADYCAGVTLWGWMYGKTWIGNGSSGLVRNKQERSALKWLRDYMQTDKAKNAKSPFPGMKKEASVYIKPSSVKASAGEEITITVDARLRTKTIDKVDLYIDGQLYKTLNSTPYSCTYTHSALGRHDLKAVVTATDRTTYERMGGFTTVTTPLKPGQIVVSKRFTSLSEIGTQSFAIVNESEGKAFYGSDNQNLGYDSFGNAFKDTNAGYLFKLVESSVNNGYLLRLITPNNAEYNVFGKPGYLNSQSTDGWCCFILGLTKGNGEDIVNGAVWNIEYVEGKGFTLRNVGTGNYLKDASPAKYVAPTYFSLCIMGNSSSGVKPLKYQKTDGNNTIYDLSGRRVSEGNIRPGIYIKNGRKVIIK